MKLEYVGPKPIVDQYGVNFDKSKPDRYIFIQVVLELLESTNRHSMPRCDWRSSMVKRWDTFTFAIPKKWKFDL